VCIWLLKKIASDLRLDYFDLYTNSLANRIKPRIGFAQKKRRISSLTMMLPLKPDLGAMQDLNPKGLARP